LIRLSAASRRLALALFSVSDFDLISTWFVAFDSVFTSTLDFDSTLLSDFAFDWVSAYALTSTLAST